MNNNFNEGKYVAMTRCFICGKEADILLAKDLTKDISKFDNTTTPETFCNECAKAMEKGVWLIEINNKPDNDVVTSENLDKVDRTGKIACIDKDFFVRNGMERYSEYPFIFVEKGLMDKIGIKFKE